ncbi:hypothetical protein [Kitasatospora sp. NPDC088346]|uniref:hypothetical protein n=1 Tax=Kitasatospora sp. NPDC088346 TaxID=3364073 RepID=UPI0038224680
MAKLLDRLLPVIDGIVHRLSPPSDRGTFARRPGRRRPTGGWADRYRTWRGSRPVDLRRPTATAMQPGDLPPDLR